jgi:hypothetical protein
MSPYPATADPELVVCALLGAQADGDSAAMRQIVDHTTPATRAAMVDLVLAELADRALTQLADAELLTTLLSRAGSVQSRLDLDDPLRRHQVVHPIRPLITALQWELGFRATDALRCW